MQYPSSKRNHYSVRTIVRSKLAKNFAHVVFDGRFSDTEGFTYLAIAAPSKHEADHSHLLRAQVRVRRSVIQANSHGVRQIFITRVCPANSIDQNLVRQTFDDIG